MTPAGRNRRSPLVLRAPWLLLAAIALLAGACSSQGISQGPAGLPANEGAQVSLVVAQTRAQFPQLSGGQIPFNPREPPAATIPAPELALRGRGVQVQPGLQMDTPKHMQAALYLDKATYAHGYLELTPDGGAAQRLPIVAYDLRGDAHKRFDFIYVLATPQGALRYLSLIGGPYTDEGTGYLGFEGTLIVPGDDNDLAHWSYAVQIDFGYRQPVVPLHQLKVKEAVALFQQLQKDMARLDTLSDQIGKTQDALAAQRAKLAAATEGATAPPEAAPPSGAAQTPADQARAAIADLQAKLKTRQAGWNKLLEATAGRFVRYYGLRQAIATEYAAFTQSNRYLWLGTAGRQAFYDQWKVVEFHHPKIDHMVEDFLAFHHDDAKVRAARVAAMTEIRKQDNWSKDPSRSARPRPH